MTAKDKAHDFKFSLNFLEIGRICRICEVYKVLLKTKRLFFKMMLRVFHVMSITYILEYRQSGHSSSRIIYAK